MPIMLSTTPKVTPMTVLATGIRYGPTFSLMSLSYVDCTWFGTPWIYMRSKAMLESLQLI